MSSLAIAPAKPHQFGGCYDAFVGEERHGPACRTARTAKPSAWKGKLCQELIGCIKNTCMFVELFIEY